MGRGLSSWCGLLLLGLRRRLRLRFRWLCFFGRRLNDEVGFLQQDFYLRLGSQVCDGAGASVIQIPFYLCFGREMWSLIRKELSGEAMAKEAALLIAKWKARGLTEAVLQGIRTDVFNVSAPIAP